MLSGIALLGVVTATLATWLVEQVAAAEKEQTQDLQSQLNDLHAQLDEVLGRLPVEDYPSFQDGTPRWGNPAHL